MKRVNNVYPMNEKNNIIRYGLHKTKFRKWGKGGFIVSKKDFKAETLFAERNRLLRDDGSVIEPNIHNKLVYRRLRRYYPFY